MKQKVLFIIHCPPPIHGAALLGKFIYDSEVINTSFNTKYIYLGTTKNFKERKKVTLRKLGHFFSLITKCFITNLTFRPQIVYLSLTSNGMGFYKDALIVMLLKLSGAKIVFHLHNKGVKRNQHKFLDDKLYKIVFKNTIVVHGAKWLYEDIQKYVPEDKVYYCHNGIPKPEFSIKERVLNQDESPQIMFLSNLIESKGVYTVLYACDVLNKKGIQFKCVYVGSEGDIKASELQNKIKELGLEDKVTYAGKKYNKEKHLAFEQADIFAFPTHYPNEVFPLVLLEAMQYSLPTVSTPEGGVRDIIDDGVTGFIIEQKNHNQLAAKLEYLIKNPEERLQMGLAGRKKYERAFTVNTYENRIKTIINRVLIKD